MHFMFQHEPFQTLALIKFRKLGKVLTHEQKLLSRMTHHKTIGCPQIRKLIFVFARHFSNHGAFAMNDLIMGQDEHKFFTVSINHTEQQLPIGALSE